MESEALKDTRIFNSPTRGELSIVDVVREVNAFVNEDPQGSYRLIIGTDSKANGANGVAKITYVSAVIVYRVSRGGRYFYTLISEKGGLDPRVRVINETLKSIILAQTFLPYLDLVLPKSFYDLEIHIDAGENGPTKEVINQAIGIVKGVGFKAQVKPNACGASTVADKHT